MSTDQQAEAARRHDARLARTRRALERVGIERDRQQLRWGEQRHALPLWAAIAVEELGEAAQAGLALRRMPLDLPVMRLRHLTAVREEWVQLAAVAIAVIEQLDQARDGGDPLPREHWASDV